MAKKDVNKTQLIKDAVSAAPEATPKEIAAALEQYGVTATYVSNVKGKMNVKPKKRGRPKRATSKSEGQPGQPAKTTDSLDAAIKFVEQSGGLKGAKAAIEKIERIKSL